MNRNVCAVLPLMLALALPCPLMADHPTVAFGSETSGPINTIAASPAPAGRWAFALRNEWIERDDLSDATLEAAAESGLEGVHSVDRLNSTSASVAYGLTDNLTVSARLPFVARDDIREGEIEDGAAEAHGHGDASGLGDLVVLASYRAFASGDVDGALQLGFKAPTGATHERDQGSRLETEFQPGTGSRDVLLGGALSRTAGRWGLHGNVLYNLNTNGSQDTEIGDALFYNVAAVFSLGAPAGHHHDADAPAAHWHLRWDAVLELNGETRWRNEIGNTTQAHSGGTVVYLSPGLRVSRGPIGAFASFGYPIVDDARGLQTDVDFRLVGGVSLTF